jgi:hypothetical protein
LLTNCFLDLKQAQEAAETQQAHPDGAAESGQKPARGPAKPAGGIADEYLPPNKNLVVRNLPDDFDTERFTELFNVYEGFVSANYVDGRSLGLAYFETEAHAISAKERTANTLVEGNAISVTYAKA